MRVRAPLSHSRLITACKFDCKPVQLLAWHLNLHILVVKRITFVMCEGSLRFFYGNLTCRRKFKRKFTTRLGEMVPLLLKTAISCRTRRRLYWRPPECFRQCRSPYPISPLLIPSSPVTTYRKVSCAWNWINRSGTDPLCADRYRCQRRFPTLSAKAMRFFHKESIFPTVRDFVI